MLNRRSLMGSATALALFMGIAAPAFADPDAALAKLQETVLSKGPSGEDPSPASSVVLSDEELAAFNDYSALADDQVQDIPEDVLALDRDMPNLTVKDGSMAFDEINFDDIIGPDPTKEEWEGQRRDLVLSEGEEYGR